MPPADDADMFTDAMTQSQGDAESIRAEAQARANALLMGAITTSDTAMFERAVREKADVNFNGGLPLRTAAQNDNKLFLRLLVTQGADITHAVTELGKEQATISRKKNYDSYYERTTYTYKNKEDERRYKQLANTSKILSDYEKTYLTNIAPVEAARLQKQVLDELRALREEITTAIHGKAIDKPKLAAPAVYDPMKKRR